MAINLPNLNEYGQAQVASINALANSANKKAQEATASARSGLDTLLGVGDTVDKSASKIRGYGDQVASLAGNQTEYANTVKGYGEQMAGVGNTLVDQGNANQQIANDILNMNADSSSPFVRELLALYGQYDPENKVSLAVQDVNNAYETGRTQLQRQNSRAGVSAGSGRSNALNQQYQILLNTAKAAAATRARSLGLTEQTNAFQTLVAGNAKDMGNQAKDYLTSGVSALANAVNSQNTAASLERNSAALFGEAANLESSALSAELGYANSVASQQNTIASALRSESSLLDSQSSRELAFMNSVMGQKVTAGVNVSSASGGSGEPSYGEEVYNAHVQGFNTVADAKKATQNKEVSK